MKAPAGQREDSAPAPAITGHRHQTGQPGDQADLCLGHPFLSLCPPARTWCPLANSPGGQPLLEPPPPSIPPVCLLGEILALGLS